MWQLLGSAGDPVVQTASSLDVSSVLVAVIGAAAGFGGSVLMFRGKTQDTANWLVKSLREDAEAARVTAAAAAHEAAEARTDARAAWERVDQCEAGHADTREYLSQLVAHLRAAGVPLPDAAEPDGLDPDAAEGPDL